MKVTAPLVVVDGATTIENLYQTYPLSFIVI